MNRGCYLLLALAALCTSSAQAGGMCGGCFRVCSPCVRVVTCAPICPPVCCPPCLPPGYRIYDKPQEAAPPPPAPPAPPPAPPKPEREGVLSPSDLPPKTK